MSSNTSNKETGEFITRVTGHGQFKINKETLDKINKIDNVIVDIVEKNDSDKKKQSSELKDKLSEIMDLLKAEGKPLEDKEILQSDLVIPSPDISLNEAKKIFAGEGILPEI